MHILVENSILGAPIWGLHLNRQRASFEHIAFSHIVPQFVGVLAMLVGITAPLLSSMTSLWRLTPQLCPRSIQKRRFGRAAGSDGIPRQSY